VNVTHDSTAGGVRTRRFELDGPTECIPGMLWTPEGATGPRPKVLFGHGGSQHKKARNLVALAEALVRDRGYACAAIDAPGHGDRVSEADRERGRERARAREQARQDATATGRPLRHHLGGPSDPYPAMFLRGVEDWTCVLDALEHEPDVGAGPTGWWGVSMGTSIGLPFVAGEPRITCAVLGLASAVPRPAHETYLGWARSLRIPVLFLCQRDDGGHPVEQALELWNLIGSAEKTMHVNPGPHVGIPAFERDESAAFFARHLG
jgi:pimeloyl-ACP methyl ester carboxylesterase